MWVNVHDNLHFLPSANPAVTNFLWSSEATGFMHHYVAQWDGTKTTRCSSLRFLYEADLHRTELQSLLANGLLVFRLSGRTRRLWMSSSWALRYEAMYNLDE